MDSEVILANPTPLPAPVLAAKRDAVWYRRSPDDDRSPPRFHIVSLDWQPACGQRAMILNDEDPMDPCDVPETRRCQRLGCRERWPDGT